MKRFAPLAWKSPESPPFPFGETEETLEKERGDLLKEIQKKYNQKVIGEIMENREYFLILKIVSR